MSAKLKKIALLYSFLPALLLPHLPRLHPPFNFLTGCCAAALTSLFVFLLFPPSLLLLFYP